MITEPIAHQDSQIPEFPTRVANLQHHQQPSLQRLHALKALRSHTDMTKFGLYLRENSVQEWANKYVNYKELKQRIGAIIDAQNQRNIAPLARGLESTTAVSAGAPALPSNISSVSPVASAVSSSADAQAADRLAPPRSNRGQRKNFLTDIFQYVVRTRILLFETVGTLMGCTAHSHHAQITDE